MLILHQDHLVPDFFFTISKQFASNFRMVVLRIRRMTESKIAACPAVVVVRSKH
jgi:hypothetical protein